MTKAASIQPANPHANCLTEKTPLRSVCVAIRPPRHSEIWLGNPRRPRKISGEEK